MGTTMSFFSVQNQGLSADVLKEKLERAFPAAPPSKGGMTDEMLARFATGGVSVEMLREIEKKVQETRTHFDEIIGVKRPETATVLAHHPAAQWLPFFEESLCEGSISSSKDTTRLSKLFEAPVLAFAIFDSDVMFVSYSDAKNKLAYDYAKPNVQDFDEYDTERYSSQFPEFLCELCQPSDREKLEEIWAADEVFADDRMEKILELLGAEAICGSSELPDGYQALLV